MKKNLFCVGCCTFLIPTVLSFSVYGASSVRSLGGGASYPVADNAADTLSISRASSLPITTKKNTSVTTTNTKTVNSVGGASSDSQRMPFTQHVSAITVPSFATVTSSSSSNQQVTDIAQRVDELEDQVANIEKSIDEAQDSITDVINVLDDKQGSLIPGGNISISPDNTIAVSGVLPVERLAPDGTPGQVLKIDGSGKNMVWGMDNGTIYTQGTGINIKDNTISLSEDALSQYAKNDALSDYMKKGDAVSKAQLASDGTPDQVLKIDGSGKMVWGTDLQGTTYTAGDGISIDNN
ncbi:MAG: hypothetical protein MJ170_04730, partial [Alphaproteobacteria bacterium]|nr:hypothetical protein [Alphaproteobacteria bacterium]